jgi:hypothetical protein
VAGTDYQVIDRTNYSLDPPSGAVEVRGKGNYTGENWKAFTVVDQRSAFNATYKILDLTQSDANGHLAFAANASYVYTGLPITPSVGVGTTKQGALVELVAGVDFEVSYTNNVEPANRTAAAAPTITITGKGAYKGTLSVKFSITDKRENLAYGFSISGLAESYTYTGAAITPAVRVKTPYGLFLDVDSGYYEVAYANNVAVGVATVTVSGTGGSFKGVISASFEIVAADDGGGGANQEGDAKPVVVADKVTSIATPLKTVYIQKGKSLVLPVVVYSGRSEITSKLTWTSSNTKVAKVDGKGKVTIAKTVKKKTKVTITAKAANGKTLKVVVYAVPKAAKITALSVSKWPAKAKLKVDKTAQLKLSIKPVGATGVKITFKSSNAKGLSINKAGKLLAKKKGTYKITVKAGVKSVSKKIKVV